jgi:hypothetical protein
VTRGDGTVYFKYPPRPMSERICHWTLVALWVFAPVLAVTMFWW